MRLGLRAPRGRRLRRRTRTRYGREAQQRTYPEYIPKTLQLKMACWGLAVVGRRLAAPLVGAGSATWATMPSYGKVLTVVLGLAMVGGCTDHDAAHADDVAKLSPD